MHLLTSAEFLDRFPSNVSIIFIGNASSLKGEKLGQWIDSHEIVVRFNECPVQGFEEDVGTRTDIVVTNPYPSGRRPLVMNGKGAVVIISPQTRRPWSAEMDEWLNDNGALFTYSPDLVQVGEVEHKATLTTGVYGIHLLSRILKPSHVNITGFTMFLKEFAHHYWDYTMPKGLQAHDMLTEASIFIRICNSIRCQMEVTEDISWVSKQTGIQLRKEIVIKSLLNKKWSE